MARGPRKTMEQKIEAKQELIEALETRLDTERTELEELIREKRLKELEVVEELIEESGLDASEVAELLRNHMIQIQTA